VLCWKELYEMQVLILSWQLENCSCQICLLSRG